MEFEVSGGVAEARGAATAHAVRAFFARHEIWYGEGLLLTAPDGLQVGTHSEAEIYVSPEEPGAFRLTRHEGEQHWTDPELLGRVAAQQYMLQFVAGDRRWLEERTWREFHLRERDLPG